MKDRRTFGFESEQPVPVPYSKWLNIDCENHTQRQNGQYGPL